MRFGPPSRNPLPTNAPVVLTAAYDHVVAGAGSAAAGGRSAGVYRPLRKSGRADHVGAAERAVRAHPGAVRVGGWVGGAAKRAAIAAAVASACRHDWSVS